MHTFILEDWLTVRGPGSDTITQDEGRWLDLEAFQDAVLYLECRNSTSGGGAPTITFQTSPAKDESLFQSCATASLTASSTPQVVPVLLASAATPLARFLRWQIAGAVGGTWDATFRLIVAANSPGM